MDREGWFAARSNAPRNVLLTPPKELTLGWYAITRGVSSFAVLSG